MIEEERRRLYDLKLKASQEVKAQWEERKQRESNYKSFNSLESEESSVTSSDAPSEKETRCVHAESGKDPEIRAVPHLPLFSVASAGFTNGDCVSTTPSLDIFFFG